MLGGKAILKPSSSPGQGGGVVIGRGGALLGDPERGFSPAATYTSPPPGFREAGRQPTAKRQASDPESNLLLRVGSRSVHSSCARAPCACVRAHGPGTLRACLAPTFPGGAQGPTPPPSLPARPALTIFSVLLRLTSLRFRRRALASMSTRRMSGMVLPPSSRMVKSTMTMVVVPMSCRFSMGSRSRWRLRA